MARFTLSLRMIAYARKGTLSMEWFAGGKEREKREGCGEVECCANFEKYFLM